jgi:hypothetical protein
MFRRLFLAAILAGMPAIAAPPLTTIQDVLYKADGTRFSGTLTIRWKSFLAGDNSDIVTQSTAVRVVDGNLRVQLVPSTTATPAASYTITYNSDGRVQFQETWAVPPSTIPLRIRDVRTTASAGAAGADTGSGSTPIPESQVVGLIADLGARPLKGPAYAAGRVALVDATGMLVSASGNSSDCMHVDGTSGPCGEGALNFVDNESPTGIVDGSNTTFALSAIPNPTSSLAVYRNGMLQKSGQDYNLTGYTLQFLAAATPQPGDTLLATYRTAGEDGGLGAAYANPQVLCSGGGGTTSSAVLANIGACQIPAGLLLPGDRVEVRLDVAHQGTTAGFSVELDWGATVLAHRDAAAADTLVTMRADASLLSAGAQLSSESWGAVLPFAAAVASASDSFANGLTISVQGMVGQAADSVSAANFTVVRIP